MKHKAAACGVGAVVNRALAQFLASHPDSVDFVELVPETLWTDYGRGERERYIDMPAAFALADALAERYPIVCHGIGLSIGSATPIDEAHLARLASVVGRYDVERYSEHLGFFRVADDDRRDRHMGLGMPLPCDEAVLEWLHDRIRHAQAVIGMPLLLENGVHHTPYADEDMSEPLFLNRLGQETGSGVLLDLHNLYTDLRNNGAPPENYIELLDLRLVREIHVAGGSVLGRAYTDSHAGACPPRVLELLREVVPRCPKLEGITFEFHESVYPNTFGPDALHAELNALAEVWNARDGDVA